MHLKVLLPFQVLSDKTNITHIVVETRGGSVWVAAKEARLRLRDRARHPGL